MLLLMLSNCNQSTTAAPVTQTELFTKQSQRNSIYVYYMPPGAYVKSLLVFFFLRVAVYDLNEYVCHCHKSGRADTDV